MKSGVKGIFSSLVSPPAGRFWFVVKVGFYYYVSAYCDIQSALSRVQNAPPFK